MSRHELLLAIKPVSLTTFVPCLKVREGDGHGAVLGQYCGTTIPEPVTSGANRLWVKFRSDYSSAGRGFHASYFASEGRMPRLAPDVQCTKRHCQLWSVAHNHRKCILTFQYVMLDSGSTPV